MSKKDFVIDDSSFAGKYICLTEQVAGAPTQTEVNQAFDNFVLNHPDALIGLSDDVKDALLECFQHVAWIDDQGQTYYQALEDALYPALAVAYIDALFDSRSATIHTTDSLNSLKQYLTVKAIYTSGAVETVASTDYTLSGTLTVGRSIITVTYDDMTTTFGVDVIDDSVTSIEAVYTQSGAVYDNASLDSLKTDLVVTAYKADSTSAVISADNYTLSGTLTAGTSTITVTYAGKTDTFDVTVTAFVLSSIEAVYTQSGTVYTTATLDSLKTDLVVTATYSDTSTETVASTDYTLSGTLTAGTSTITVTYESKTTTFTVTVTEYVRQAKYSWDFTQSLTDTVEGVTATCSSGAQQSSSGLSFTNTSACCLLGTNVFPVGSTLELDIASMSPSLNSGHGRLVMFADSSSPTVSSNVGNGFIWRSTGKWAFYKGSWSDSSNTDDDLFAGKKLTLKYYYSSDDSKYHTDVYCDNDLVKAYTHSSKWNSSISPVQIGSNGNTYRQMVITGARIYEGVD